MYLPLWSSLYSYPPQETKTLYRCCMPELACHLPHRRTVYGHAADPSPPHLKMRSNGMEGGWEMIDKDVEDGDGREGASDIPVLPY